MQKITEAQFKKNFVDTLYQVSSTNVPIIISRKSKPYVVILSLEDCKYIANTFSLIEDFHKLLVDSKTPKTDKQEL